MDVFSKLVTSIRFFFGLVLSRSLHSSRQNLGNRYRVSDGKAYSVFRETISDKEYDAKEVTLVIGFRLKFIGGSRLFHRLFQYLCVFDTPIWVGFQGFRTKFWMVEPITQDYLGIYRYQGKGNARAYAEYITAVLQPVSIRGSVWCEIREEAFGSFTESRRVT